MFYDNFVKLCNEKGEAPTAVARLVGMDKSAATRWSNGSVPRDTTLVKLAKHFGVTVDELLGETPRKVVNVASEEKEAGGLEAALEALRNQPGRRALLSATKNMTEAQVLRFADWLADITGGDKD